MRNRAQLAAVVLTAVTVLSVVAVPVAGQQVSISTVDLPNTVSQGDTFTVDVSVTGSDIENVEATLTVPDGLSCTPSGSQSVSLSGGSGSTTFSCSADIAGDYSGEIGVTVSADRTDNGDTISDSSQTGLSVLSPASLTQSASLDASSVSVGSSTTLTLVIHNTGDASTSYDASVSTGDGLSVAHAGGTTSGSVDGGAIQTVDYTVTGDAEGTHAVDFSVTAGTGQTLSGSESVSVTSDDSGDGGSSAGAGSGGGGSSLSPEQSTSGGDGATTFSKALEDEDPSSDGTTVRFEPGEVDGETQSPPVDEITFDEAVSTSEQIEVTVTDEQPAPADVGSDVAAVVRTFEVSTPSSVADSGATVEFGVSEAELDGRDPDAVRLARQANDGTWESYEAAPVDVDADPVRFQATVDGFSRWSVVVGQVSGDTTTETESSPTETTTAEATTTTTDATSPTDGTSATTTTTEASEGLPGFTAVIAVLALLGSALVAARRRG